MSGASILCIKKREISLNIIHSGIARAGVIRKADLIAYAWETFTTVTVKSIWVDSSPRKNIHLVYCSHSYFGICPIKCVLTLVPEVSFAAKREKREERSGKRKPLAGNANLNIML